MGANRNAVDSHAMSLLQEKRSLSVEMISQIYSQPQDESNLVYNSRGLLYFSSGTKRRITLEDFMALSLS
jgi:hypothetical protein